MKKYMKWNGDKGLMSIGIQEAGANQIEGQTAYMLFFERDAIDMKAYLPKIREPSVSSAESAATSSSDSSALSSNQQPSATTVSTGAVPPAAVVPGAASDEDEAGKKCVIMWNPFTNKTVSSLDSSRP